MATPDYGVQQAMVSALARLTGPQNESKKTDVEFVHLANPAWPLSPSVGGNLTPAKWRERERRPIRISVLDSSFNPPTKAHLALASSPPPISSSLASPEGVPDRTAKVQLSSGKAVEKQESRMPTYDAHMLLLSVTNADKKLKPSDATYQQRLEMMALLSQEVQSANEPAGPSSYNICVAAIDEPTFVGKSRKLRKAIARKLFPLSGYRGHNGQHSSDSEMVALEQNTIAEWEKEINLFFVLGFDTVTRLFDPRFYGSVGVMRESLRSFFACCEEGGDGSHVVCARRQLSNAKKGGDDGDKSAVGGVYYNAQGQSLSLTSGMSEEELNFFTSPEVKEYWESGRVSLMNDLNVELQTISSTKARTSLADALGSDVEVRRLLPSSIANYVFQRGLYSQLQA